MTGYICSLKILVTYILIWELIYLGFDCACSLGLLGGGKLRRPWLKWLYLFWGPGCIYLCFILMELLLVLTLVNAYLFPDLIAVAWSVNLHVAQWQFIKQQNKPKPKSTREAERKRKVSSGRVSSHWISQTKSLGSPYLPATCIHWSSNCHVMVFGGKAFQI